MLIIVGLVVFGGLAARTSKLIAREQALFAEFHVETTLGTWVWLFPAPAALLLTGLPIVTRVLVGFGAAVLFFLPGICSAVQAGRQFETTGTDRFDPAQRVASEVIFAGIVGIAAVVVWCVIYWVLGPSMPRA